MPKIPGATGRISYPTHIFVLMICLVWSRQGAMSKRVTFTWEFLFPGSEATPCRPTTNIRLLGPYIDKFPTAHYKIHIPGNPGNELSGHYDHVRHQIPNNRKV